MKNTFNNIRWCPAAIALAAIAALAMPLSAQLDIDSATGIPQLMVVDSVDSEAGTVTLNGNVYRVSIQKRQAQAALSPNGRALELSDLKPGMEVVVSTDGTMPSESHQPRLKGIWKPR